MPVSAAWGVSRPVSISPFTGHAGYVSGMFRTATRLPAAPATSQNVGTGRWALARTAGPAGGPRSSPPARPRPSTGALRRGAHTRHEAGPTGDRVPRERGPERSGPPTREQPTEGRHDPGVRERAEDAERSPVEPDHEHATGPHATASTRTPRACVSHRHRRGPPMMVVTSWPRTRTRRARPGPISRTRRERVGRAPPIAHPELRDSERVQVERSQPGLGARTHA